jgi:hypothetical protein
MERKDCAMSFNDYVKSFGKGAVLGAVAAVVGAVAAGGTADAGTVAAVVGGKGIAAASATASVAGFVGGVNDPHPLSFGAGIFSGLSGMVALAFHLAATEVPKAPDVPVNDKPAIEQQAPKNISGLSHQEKLAQIASEHGLTLG